MNRLSEDVILSLVNRFCALTTDAPRKDITDQLGKHPVNHAIFARLLTQRGHANDWQVYLAVTAWMG